VLLEDVQKKSSYYFYQGSVSIFDMLSRDRANLNKTCLKMMKHLIVVQVFLTTAYFVDPDIICGPGRTQEEYDVDGTGYALYLQVPFSM